MTFLNKLNYSKKITRFYWLDILRGIAALSVVLWHWHHFFFDNHLLNEAEQHIDKTGFPFYSFLRPLYGQGWRAVELFFTLSGFIFFWLYSEKIAENKISFLKYLKLRISRLYPLHVVMLFLIIIEQHFYFLQTGLHFIYHDYHLTTFIANFSLTGNWFYSQYSFNGPAWSISVEMFLYIIFFGFCLLKLNHVIYTFLLIIIGLFLKGTQVDSMATGVMSFFCGGVAYYLYQFLYSKFNIKGHIYFILISSLSGFLIIVLYRYILSVNLPFYFFEFFMFPVIITNIALLEATYGSKAGKTVSFIGDVSYSSYMIHFPLQLAFVLVASFLNLKQSIFLAPFTLIIFYIILIMLSFLSYYYFEKPIQNYLRKAK